MDYHKINVIEFYYTILIYGIEMFLFYFTFILGEYIASHRILIEYSKIGNDIWYMKEELKRTKYIYPFNCVLKMISLKAIPLL